MARERLVAAGAGLALLAGCGGSSPADQVRATAEGYAKAFARHDYQALCDRYLAPTLLEGLRQTGLPCESAVRESVESTQRPTLTVRGVTVRGDSATAQIHTSAAGQAPSDDTMALVRVKGEWRISALAQPGPQPVGP